jgi:hypothetical protein
VSLGDGLPKPDDDSPERYNMRKAYIYKCWSNDRLFGGWYYKIEDPAYADYAERVEVELPEKVRLELSVCDTLECYVYECGTYLSAEIIAKNRYDEDKATPQVCYCGGFIDLKIIGA